MLLLPNSETGNVDYRNNSGESFNYGLLLSWQLAKDKPWYIKSGLSWTNMNFSTSTTYLGDNMGYFVNNTHEIKQIDLPILVGYMKTFSSFQIGLDAGLIKTIWLDSEINQNSEFQVSGSNPEFEQLSINPSGFTDFSDKYSFYAAPIVQWNFGKTSGISLQPFYRIQLGNKSGLIYTPGSGSIKQFGVNLGYNFRF
ncbi:hypothetical protein SAMN04489724_0197 [Algoriphagus locisalis]|uniref:Outer membrane protein beta-barrel domain-containing protein n=1 Tax=Algoriphagus locisalis TaxID=305507 RepID=A0A1I7E7B5_9BACT|nr:hypothetical protein [Algoriphagus locisalis]SFU19785.1 hypothetical protein SAMN04489724_0197 [Algoriphagus locisalis]